MSRCLCSDLGIPFFHFRRPRLHNMSFFNSVDSGLPGVPGLTHAPKIWGSRCFSTLCPASHYSLWRHTSDWFVCVKGRALAAAFPIAAEGITSGWNSRFALLLAWSCSQLWCSLCTPPALKRRTSMNIGKSHFPRCLSELYRVARGHLPFTGSSAAPLRFP